MKTTTGAYGTIDLEPTWESLCNASQVGALQPIELLPACIIADKIRQAQKAGAESITFTFGDNGIEIEEIYPDAMGKIIQELE